MSKEDTVIVPVYPNFENNTSIIQFKDYDQRLIIMVCRILCWFRWLAIDWELQNYNHSKFKNNFTPSAIVEINGDMGEEEAEKLVKDAQKK